VQVKEVLITYILVQIGTPDNELKRGLFTIGFLKEMPKTRTED